MPARAGKATLKLGIRLSEEADVVIVGTGLSGLAAAMAALDAEVVVAVLEKAPSPGENSIISGGGANAVDPRRQASQGVYDSIDLH